MLRLFGVVIALFTIVLSADHDENGINRCAMKDLTETQFRSSETHRNETLKRKSQKFTSAIINVYFHSITNMNGDGMIDQQQVDSQLSVLNSAFSESGFSFVFKELDVSRNDTWYQMEPGNLGEYDAKTELRVGNASDLNIYIANIASWASYPKDYHCHPQMDGVVLQYTTLPGGTQTNYNQGKVGVHQVGHWLGLYHTFQGGCYERGGTDGVSDTNSEKEAHFGCPGVIDSCPDNAGNDPTDNYMSYVYDKCMHTFTKGQITRMQFEYTAYRSYPHNATVDYDSPILGTNTCQSLWAV